MSQESKQDSSSSILQENYPPPQGVEITHLSIVKRSGAIVPFQKSRVYAALEAAFRDTKKIGKDAPIPEELLFDMREVAENVVKEVLHLSQKKVSVTVEGIQDLVEVTLMNRGHHSVARDYIIYRDKHKKLREDDPRQIKIYRYENRQPVKLNPIKISSSIAKIFHHSQKTPPYAPEKIIEAVNDITELVLQMIQTLAKKEDKITLSQIGDCIETAFMKLGYFDLAKKYILHRASEKKMPNQEEKKLTEKPKKPKRESKQGDRIFSYVQENGSTNTISEADLLNRIDHACRGFETLVTSEEILHQAVLNFYEGITEKEIDQALIITTKARIEEDPAFAKITARLLLDQIYRQILGADSADLHIEKKHKENFISYIKKGISLEYLDPKLALFDLELLAEAIDLSRDDLFQYLGLQTLYDRYLIHHREVRLETPQMFWMRIAMGLSIQEQDPNQRAIEFYNLFSQFDYMCSTPTLFNSGTRRPQLSSCFLLTVGDDLKEIFKLYSDNAQLSKHAGGIGDDWTNVRGTGAYIKGTNGQSQGIIPFLKIANDTAVAVNQGGKRKGAMCAYLEVWHIDVEDFLELRKNTGDDRRRAHDMNTAVWIPDLFMQRVKENGSWLLFSPNEVPDLHDLYGKNFADRYCEYEAKVEKKEIKLWKKVEAVKLWRKMLTMLFETGHPWITFKDPSNIRSPQDHVGVIHSSNLCTEILLNTSKDEVAVCNLGSINLCNHLTQTGIDEQKLEKTLTTAVRALDNVIDINFYPIPETKRSNLSHRPIGVGMMGFQTAIQRLGISYASHEAVEFADQSAEMISYYTILASSKLAKERNPYPSYKGSKWERNILPIDTIDLLERERGEPVDMNRSTTMNWDIVRDSIKRWGMRNSNVLALAPTATIANIVGVSPSTDPHYKNIYVKSNLSGEFTINNPELVAKLKSLDLWDEQMLDDLKYFDGSILEIDRIPGDIKKLFLTAFEISYEWIIECASRRQKWYDQSLSTNLYLPEPDGKKLHQMYLLSFHKGLKTTYYLRTLGATQIEKSSLDINQRGLQPKWMKSKSPSSRVQVKRETNTPSVCTLDEGCESCQ